MTTCRLCGAAIVAFLMSIGWVDADTLVSQISSTNKPLAKVGPHHRVLARQQVQGKSLGDSPGVVELATGLNYWDGQQWAPSEAVFEESPQGGFVARKVQHPVSLPNDLNVAGAVEITTPDKISLSSTPVGIALFDEVSGQFEVIAAITNCSGVQVSSNQIVYADAFAGSGIDADIVYTITPSSFEQDIVFRSPLDPVDFGYTRENTRVQILSEFFGSTVPDRERFPIHVEPNPAIRQKKACPDLMDETLNFGELTLGSGNAFALSGMREKGRKVAVVKEFKKIDNRSFLVESVQFPELQDELLALPQDGSNDHAMVGRKSKRTYASIPKAGTSLHASVKKPGAQRTAQLALGKRAGVVVDYRATLNSGSTALQANTTYLVSGSVTCPYLSVEGGSVVKYMVGASIVLTSSGSSGSGTAPGYLVCKTANYSPAVFTCIDDDSVGESMNGYTGAYTGVINPSGYADPAISISTNNLTVSNCFFRHAKTALLSTANLSIFLNWHVNHSQFYNCIRGIKISGSGANSAVVELNNDLIAGVQYPFSVNGVQSPKYFNLSHCTIDQATSLVDGAWGWTFCGCQATNSVFANITTYGQSNICSGVNNGFYKSVHFGSPGAPVFGTDTTSPFDVAVGGASYYLNDTAGFRNVGTVLGPPSWLLADITRKTTRAPIVLANDITAYTTLPPAALRDVDLPDLGYHYDPLDYCLSGRAIAAGKTLCLAPGVALGVYGQQGLTINSGSSLISEGTPTQMNRLVRYNAVQERSYLWGTSPSQLTTDLLVPMSASQVQFRFTAISLIDGIQGRLWAPNTASDTSNVSFKDCALRGVYFHVANSAGTMALSCVNNVFERCDLLFQTPLTLTLKNNLFWGGTLGLICQTTGASWQVRDNLLDGASVTQGTQTFPNSYNAYRGSTLINGGANSKTLTSCDYQSGPLGQYYYPSTGTLLHSLMDYDTSTTAAQAGFYHYTTQTTLSGGLQIKELAGSLDAGFHYVAMDSNGNPIDTDADGLPDYLEDTTGEGTFNTGDLSDWLTKQTDSDGDGLPDAWEYAHFGTLAWGPNDDPDQDGLPNLWEYNLGLDPLINQRQLAGARRNYGYDLLNRLTGVTGQTHVTITPDKEGNLQSVTP